VSSNSFAEAGLDQERWKKRKRGTLTVPRLLAQDIQPQRLLIVILRVFFREGKLIFDAAAGHFSQIPDLRFQISNHTRTSQLLPRTHAPLFTRTDWKLTLPPFAILDFRFMIAGPPPGSI
jgi:hypothetical protein